MKQKVIVKISIVAKRKEDERDYNYPLLPKLPFYTFMGGGKKQR